jgi:hypothetical protein
LKNWRRLDTRHDRAALNYFAALAFVATTAERS